MLGIGLDWVTREKAIVSDFGCRVGWVDEPLVYLVETPSTGSPYEDRLTKLFPNVDTGALRKKTPMFFFFWA